ncbi:MAG: beta-propeller domain-containing protein, partial [Campylobacter sp.]|nr:beta-propeller domain-containing protein [Campylobacter sp.]
MCYTIYDYTKQYYYTKLQIANQVYSDSQDQQIIVYSDDYLKIYEFDGTDIENVYSSDNNIIDTRLFGNQFYYVESFSNYDNINEDEVDWDQLYYDGISSCNCIYKLIRLNLNNIDDKTVVDLASGYSATVYMNQTNIVIANESYICYDADITLACMFDLDLKSLGVYAFEGSINDQYSMDVYENYFRVVSTTDNRLNYLSIFDMDSKKVISVLGGIGKKNETVRSVSFTDTKCYVVTYVNTDPLYEIDLTNPYKPVIVDALEVPGYSSYMKPFEINGETYIFGAGYASTFSYKYSIFKDGEENSQIGEDYIINTFESRYYIDVVDYNTSVTYFTPRYTYRTNMCIDPH